MAPIITGTYQADDFTYGNRDQRENVWFTTLPTAAIGQGPFTMSYIKINATPMNDRIDDTRCVATTIVPRSQINAASAIAA
ncbi:MAG: hypothetical protein WBC95_03655 [Albidovulum sp.]